MTRISPEDLERLARATAPRLPPPRVWTGWAVALLGAAIALYAFAWWLLVEGGYGYAGAYAAVSALTWATLVHEVGHREPIERSLYERLSEPAPRPRLGLGPPLPGDDHDDWR